MEDIGMALEMGFSVKVKANPGNLTRDELQDVLKIMMESSEDIFPDQSNLDKLLEDEPTLNSDDRLLEDEILEKCKGLEISCKVVHYQVLKC